MRVGRVRRCIERTGDRQGTEERERREGQMGISDRAGLAGEDDDGTRDRIKVWEGGRGESEGGGWRLGGGCLGRMGRKTREDVRDDSR